MEEAIIAHTSQVMCNNLLLHLNPEGSTLANL
jgi:hypothetical protein